ncbi:hypothetical protein K431DRAFT_90653 [Polychaeton citri CBS 116435]|uniref:Uncharacterized protein n=1 Tax=Polychaeton citri CBS 116435 TaxID=1314669 RepID=A0A9P4Q4H8_9PEZI|nr:hypothetical protein K431DRAFT_90653 [Polychaeton citri CBS 116435]
MFAADGHKLHQRSKRDRVSPTKTAPPFFIPSVTANFPSSNENAGQTTPGDTRCDALRRMLPDWLQLIIAWTTSVISDNQLQVTLLIASLSWSRANSCCKAQIIPQSSHRVRNLGACRPLEGLSHRRRTYECHEGTRLFCRCNVPRYSISWVCPGCDTVRLYVSHVHCIMQAQFTRDYGGLACPIT